MVVFLVASVVWLPPWAMACVFTLIILISSWEWGKLAGLTSTLARIGYCSSCLLLIVLIVWQCQLFTARVEPILQRDILGLGCLWWSIALLWVKSYPSGAMLWGSVLMRCLMGFLTLIPAWLAVVYLRAQENGVGYLLVLFALVACADIGAYFAGRTWGKAKLAPAVSPGKSWAGFWGGVTMSCLFALLVWTLWGQSIMPLVAVVVIALFTVLASVLGDLLESMVKRHQGVKDSGTILPGHGGMMDRIDSMTAAAPVFALSLILVG